MSAFMVSDAHIDALAQYACRRDSCGSNRLYPKSDLAKADAEALLGGGHPNLVGQEDIVGAILYHQNAASVETRYEDCRTSNAMGTKDPYTFRRVSDRKLTPALVLQAVRCYRYQACETKNADDTLAFAICCHIEHQAIAEIADDQPWGIEDEHVRATAKVS